MKYYPWGMALVVILIMVVFLWMIDAGAIYVLGALFFLIIYLAMIGRNKAGRDT